MRHDGIVDAARRYVAAVTVALDAPRETLAYVEADAALHALIVAVDERCPLCDPGTCPLAPAVVDTLPL